MNLCRNLFLLTAALLACSLFIGNNASNASLASAHSLTGTHDEQQPVSWIIKWKDHTNPDFHQNSEILHIYSKQRIVVTRPAPNWNTAQWLSYWGKSKEIEYIQQNDQVTLAGAPDDPLYVKQDYLQLIHAEEAWDVADSNSSIVIALVDTGVDLNHPELKDNLVPGINILDPESPPQDDNGHGTNVAGIIAAAGNNETGVAGLLWKAKIMPIKALEADGTGGEASLGQGIRYAVDHGAKIVVLSLGLNKYTPYLSEIVQYAEDHDVLLVAASGNEGNVVKYPAAYPTVLAVGGMTSDKHADERSNFGPELDLVAPWDVFTTALGSAYEYKDGTSMAAPQVAAVCALAWSRYPAMKAYQIRNLIRQTAEDLDQPNWDPHTGYGLLRADLALTSEYKDDMFEPNEDRSSAKPLTLGKSITAEINGNGDQDWFTLNPDYDGTVEVDLKPESDQGTLHLIYYDGDHPEGTDYTNTAENNITFNVNKGTSYVQIVADGLAPDGVLPYQLLAKFQIYRDPFEDNDHQYSAYTLPVRSQQIVGTFDHMNDQDWYVLPVENSGRLKVSLSVDTARIDPVLLIQREGEKPVTIDRNPDGGSETSPIIQILPGEYYIRVSNIKDYAYPVDGEYKLQIDYAEKSVDPNEPNDKPFQSTEIAFDSLYNGVLDKPGDIDWFKFKLDEAQLTRIQIEHITQPIQMNLYNHDLKLLETIAMDEGSDNIRLVHLLQAGDYYLRLSTDAVFPHASYDIQLHAAELVAGFADISDHWAVQAISDLKQKGIIDGYGDYMFRPDQSITRAEVAALLAKAFHPDSAGASKDFSDVSDDYWAYQAIREASEGGWIDGYPDGSFAPDKPLTRREMAAIFSRVLGIPPISEGDPPFNDVNNDDWAAAVLRGMKADGRIGGYPDGSFRPGNTATRAEFAYLLDQALQP